MFKLSFRQQAIAGFFFSVILVFGVFLSSYISIRTFQKNQELVDHTEKVINTAEKVLTLLLDGETSQRGYLITSNKDFLMVYDQSISQVEGSLQRLDSLTADNPDQQNNLSLLHATVSKRMAEMALVLTIAKNQDLGKARDRVILANSKVEMDNVRLTIAKIVDMGNNLLLRRKSQANTAANSTIQALLYGGLVIVLVVFLLFFYVLKTFGELRKTKGEVMEANAELAIVNQQKEAKNWLLTGVAELNSQLHGQQEQESLAEKVISSVCDYANAQLGTIYLYDEAEHQLDFSAAYAFHDLSSIKKHIKLGDGWLGQMAISQKPSIIKGKINPEHKLNSSIIDQEISESFIIPFLFDEKLKGIMEIGFTALTNADQQAYLTVVSDLIGVSFHSSQAQRKMLELLEETRQQAEELAGQQEELRTINEELIHQAGMLQASEEELRVQQDELRTTNGELEEKAEQLEEKNRVIEDARLAIGIKMSELETASRYKSEFLANMSHELRTPLNSILVLARILKDNKPANLNNDQIKYASVIFKAGDDLLTLINDILDLSKIESGKLEIENEKVRLNEFAVDMESLFAEVASAKKIVFATNIAPELPGFVITDKAKAAQIVKNLLSNAFKFTPENGSVELNFDLSEKTGFLALHIKDSGIGISEEKQQIIFEAFRQADGSTSRVYGGTGLGLSISRELANLLGGEICLESKPGAGSKFTLLLPLNRVMAPSTEVIATGSAPLVNLPEKPGLKEGNKNRVPLVLIVEDDLNFADLLKDYAREHGYQSILLHDGSNVVKVAKEKLPDAIILDIMLPHKDGWQILKDLKSQDETRHIPVHLMSAGDAPANRIKEDGAISFLRKPIMNETLDQLFNTMMSQTGVVFKQVLLVEDHEIQSSVLKMRMESQGIMVDQAFDGKSALRMLHENIYQCMILDLNLPDISGYELLDQVKADPVFSQLPVIINTATELDKASVNRLMAHTNAMVFKSKKSAERLIDEVNLFLQKVSSNKPAVNLNSLKPKLKITGDQSILKGTKILLVDDDMRNIFALSSALQDYEMEVEIATDGEEALAKLKGLPEIDLVLMDIMMPKMDGYEAMRLIRKESKWAKLPIIALTAKAMKEDREKCLAAGANDYMTKPVDVDKLIALIKMWVEGRSIK